MIAEKSHTAQHIIEKISGSAGKVGFINDSILTRAMMYLENKGIPSNKNEDYKYCNMDAVIKREFKDVQQKFGAVPDLNNWKLDGTIRLVILNGAFSPALSDKINENGVAVTPFFDLDKITQEKIGSIADVDSDGFLALNTAFAGNGFHLKIKKGIKVALPIHILYVVSADGECIVNPRTLVEVEEGASVVIIEQHVLAGTGKVFSNSVGEKFVGVNASLTSYTFQNEGPGGYCVNSNQVNVARDAHYNNTTISLSGQVVRNNHNVVLAGEHSQAHLNGLFTSMGHQLVDNHTLMDHRVPNCESNELYKGIIGEKSVAVFNGKIFVRRDAQKTNAYQSSKNILLSDDATINTKPQLEIYANDVKCSHGTSTGKIDENALFYLNTRGIGEKSGRRLLLSSFALEVINKIEVESLKNTITQQFEKQV